MAATFNWCEDNGAVTSSHGTTQVGFGGSSPFPNDVNWKNVDNCTNNGGTAYSAAPIQAGNNSYPKYQYGYLSGTFNQVSSALYAHTAGTFGSGLTLAGNVTSTYTTPSTTAISGSTNITTAISIGSGFTVLFSTTGPWGSTSSTLTSSGAGYTQYLVTQLQTTTGASPGDTTTVTMTLQYNEN